MFLYFCLEGSVIPEHCTHCPVIIVLVGDPGEGALDTSRVILFSLQGQLKMLDSIGRWSFRNSD